MSRPDSSAPLALRVAGVGKTFEHPHERVHTLKERALHPLRRTTSERFVALRDVSFDVRRGESFGIVGRNGSGKSTLLKCIAGIFSIDGGTIALDGRLSTFIELGVGFNPDLPARDNIVLNGTMLGLSPREAARRCDEVIAFAELEEFADLKLKNYSSGMEVRLAFSIMIQVDADILLVDEVLAVGDAAFQQKCFDEFARIRRQGHTIVLVTHDMGAVQRFCDRAVLLERGDVVLTGEPAEVAHRYLELNFEREDAPSAAEEPGDGPGDEDAGDEPRERRLGDGRAEVVEAWFEKDGGTRTDVLHVGEPAAFCLRVRFHDDVTDPLFGVNVLNAQDATLLSASNLWQEPELGEFRRGEEVVARISFDNVLAPGRYHATPAVARSGGGQFGWLDRRERFADVLVTGTRVTDALVDLPYAFALER